MKVKIEVTEGKPEEMLEKEGGEDGKTRPIDIIVIRRQLSCVPLSFS